ncbi:MAG TPA: serine hydrolase [Bacteroidales bacterium]|nr:serine hydrolase [Bacteroidales bacterium]OQB58767.1 MAG: 6-aminohexanoate-dimer hydrolase [Bacteroidetes bacterium ADurb.Bin145]HOU02968.1 serine hydrolase [Bacteroidales bacterium]HQG63261.1 serine hydrolase [Bacteroidales bacterium]HQK68260.1 serine hydrolase [Bacteroidales bacterium]
MKSKSFFCHLSLVLLIACAFSLGCSRSAETPVVSEDGLTRSTPEEQGVPSQTIANFFKSVEEKGYDVHGLMMIRHGKVIVEHWWAPYAPDYQHAMYSATKTFTGAAVGFAVQEGLLNIEDKVISFFPDLLPDTISPQLAGLTVKHLLTMSVGHASTRYTGSGLSQIRSFLAAKFAYDPGTSFAYNITASHMLSHIISKVSGVTISEYLKPRLLDPLGIKDVIWEMDNDGYNMGNGGSHMKTSDMAKMGLFLLNKGLWNGQQLLDPAWIEAATTPHIFQHPEWTKEQIDNAKDDGAQGYGYQIWMGRHNSYRAIGGQNQLIMVIPEYDFILVCHSSIGDEAGFNSLIYDMLPSMSDKPLKADKSFDLKAAISGYEIKRPFTGSSISKVKTSTRRFKMDENAAGVSNILFRFDASGNCYLTFITAGAIHNIPFGLDTWLHGMTDRTLSIARTVYPNAMGVTPVNTAGICTWTAENQLSAYYLSMFNPGSDETFRFTFDGDKLKMEIIAPTRRRLGPPDMQQPEPGNIVLSGTRIRD